MPKENNPSAKTPADAIKMLWHEGFFKTWKSIADISKALVQRGNYFSSSTLATALWRADYLTKTGARRSYKYAQKRPPELTDKKSSPKKVFASYDFHPKIKAVSQKQFENGHFKEAIQNALVEVIDQVKTTTGNPKDKNGRDLDGDDLMNRIFACDNQVPKIKFNNLNTGLDKAEQRGIMYLFKGVVGIRDRKAHLNFLQNDPKKTIEYLALASLLLRLLDENSK